MFDYELPKFWFKSQNWRRARDNRMKILLDNDYKLKQVAREIYGLAMMKSFIVEIGEDRSISMSEICELVGTGSKNCDDLQRVAIMYLQHMGYILAQNKTMRFSFNSKKLWLMPKLSENSKAAGVD